MVKDTETKLIIKLSKWIAGNLSCPAILTGTVTVRTGKAIRFKGKGYPNSTYCMVCGIELTNENSKQRGIGPICAEKFGIDNSSFETVNQSLKEYDVWIPLSQIEVIQGIMEVRQVSKKVKGPETIAKLVGDHIELVVPYRINKLAKGAPNSKWDKVLRKWILQITDANLYYLSHVQREFEEFDPQINELMENTLNECHDHCLYLWEWLSFP